MRKKNQTIKFRCREFELNNKNEAFQKNREADIEFHWRQREFIYIYFFILLLLLFSKA